MPDGMRHAWDSDVEFILPVSADGFCRVCRRLYTWYAVAAPEFFGCCRGTASAPEVRLEHFQKYAFFLIWPTSSTGAQPVPARARTPGWPRPRAAIDGLMYAGRLYNWVQDIVSADGFESRVLARRHFRLSCCRLSYELSTQCVWRRYITPDGATLDCLYTCLLRYNMSRSFSVNIKHD